MQPSEDQRKLSFNGELNGLLGAGLLGSSISESTRPISTDCSVQECQRMWVAPLHLYCSHFVSVFVKIWKLPIKLNGYSLLFSSCLTGDDGSTCVPIVLNNVEIVASQDSGINSKARGSNKVILDQNRIKSCCSHESFSLRRDHSYFVLIKT